MNESMKLYMALFRECRGLFVLLRGGNDSPRVKELLEEKTAAIEMLLEQIEPGCLEAGWDLLSAMNRVPRPGAEELKDN